MIFNNTILRTCIIITRIRFTYIHVYRFTLHILTCFLLMDLQYKQTKNKEIYKIDDDLLDAIRFCFRSV